MKINLNAMVTEGRNKNSMNIDTLSTLELVKIINEEDKKVAVAVEAELNNVAKSIDKIVDSFKNGGRLIYIGAGTSGRLGILDASECPPTYGTSPEMVIGIIAGGEKAILKAVENAEDNEELCVEDLKKINFNKKDILVGIAASGRTPYVMGGLKYANNLGATTVGISCNPDSIIAKTAIIAISPIVGPEVVTGSSRMKAGTAQKLILNMLTTGSMIKMGKVYSNLMVDVEATNLKLVERQGKIVVDATGCSKEEAEIALSKCDRHCKTAIFMILSGKNVEEAQEILKRNEGYIRKALEETYQEKK
ncbi:MAG: N-acetylmuramic acid 6-phosphate etherase [Fusobacteriaceae bacterium]